MKSRNVSLTAPKNPKIRVRSSHSIAAIAIKIA